MSEPEMSEYERSHPEHPSHIAIDKLMRGESRVKTIAMGLFFVALWIWVIS